MMSIDVLKKRIKNAILKLGNIKTLHIVGCARSGTTMLHYSMVAFENVHLYDKETHVWDSRLFADYISLCSKNIFKSSSILYVTKRSYLWWKPDHIEKLANEVKENGIFIMNIVRDPRDVLVSKHNLYDRTFYVDPEKWLSSIMAGEKLFDMLIDYKDKLTIKYEDVVKNPDKVLHEIEEVFNIHLSPEIDSWGLLKDNIENLKMKAEMIPYLNKLRNFDSSSIGSWKLDEKKRLYVKNLMQDEHFAKPLMAFMEKYNYQ